MSSAAICLNFEWKSETNTIQIPVNNNEKIQNKSVEVNSTVNISPDDCLIYYQLRIDLNRYRSILLFHSKNSTSGLLELCFKERQCCPALVSNSNNFVVYTDVNKYLWYFGLDIIEETVIQETDINRKTSDDNSFHLEKNSTNNNTVVGQTAITGSDRCNELILQHTRISPDKIVVQQLAAGVSHCLILTTASKVYSFGTNNNGELGMGNKQLLSTKVLQKVLVFSSKIIHHDHETDCSSKDHEDNEKKPANSTSNVIIDMNVKYIAAGSYYSAIITTNGSLFTFGNGSYYKLGHGDDQDHHSPTRVEALEGVGSCLPDGTSTGKI